ncbi:MAG: ribonuclease H family protein [Crocinitomicaceae bacterium]|nr:ribonuclease H family protein [Crocinitomicaceae bacterium]MBK8924453.1 ribonuclease H family protein [Crocinitomicaceae bacterium]
MQHPEKFENTKRTEKNYFYVVWYGFKPGIYEDWTQAQKSISGFPKALYKTFGSRALAEKAFLEGPEKYREGNFKKTKNLSPEELEKIGKPVELSLCVDAACNNKGQFEYQGVWTFNNEKVFSVGPYPNGSNNIGEFLALVHALAYLSKQRDEKLHTLPVYTDSRIAMKWVKIKKCLTNKTPGADVMNLIHRAEKWLRENTYQNKILKWETKVWGEIPADFGRK